MDQIRPYFTGTVDLELHKLLLTMEHLDPGLNEVVFMSWQSFGEEENLGLPGIRPQLKKTGKMLLMISFQLQMISLTRMLLHQNILVYLEQVMEVCWQVPHLHNTLNYLML